MNAQRQVVRRWALAVALVTVGFTQAPARAELVTIDWVTVGDPGNVGQTSYDFVWDTSVTLGAVAKSYRIMKYEFTNAQYVAFLNAVDPQGTNPNSIYSIEMGRYRPAPTISNSGTVDGSRYEVMPNMGDKPVNFVSWFDAARVANWLHNGQGSGSTETGAYTLNNAMFGNAPAVNPGARFYIPTESEWHKAAFYDPTIDPGDPTIDFGGYWYYGNGGSMAPGIVSADETGVGSAGSTGNFANYKNGAKWTGNGGFVTTVGTNGGASYYGAFDMSGNLEEWNDLDGLVATGSFRGIKGGNWSSTIFFELSFSSRSTGEPSFENNKVGFRLASPVAVPEPSTWAMAGIGIACAGWRAFRRRRAR